MKESKKYLCIGKEESVMYNWSECFTVGELYEEFISDWNTASGTLHLIDDRGKPMFTDADQFEEFPECTPSERQLWNFFWGFIFILALSAFMSFVTGLLISKIF